VLLVSSSRYVGTPTLTPGLTVLPGGGGTTAVADGSFPDVFLNANDGLNSKGKQISPDSSFGVTSPIYIDRYSLVGHDGTDLDLRSRLAVPTSQLVTSFSSKSELALNPSTDGKSVSFMGYDAPTDALDVSNSNTPGHIDLSNPVVGSTTGTPLAFARAVGQIDAIDGDSVRVTAVNSYSGNNGRAAILDNDQNEYFLAGNAGNGKCNTTYPANPLIIGDTGVQLATPSGSAETTVVGQEQGTPNSCTGWQFGFAIPAPGDKSGKDDNFRGETIFTAPSTSTRVAAATGSTRSIRWAPPDRS